MYNNYTDFFEKGQQIINFNLYEIKLPKSDPVYTLKRVMEQMNFLKLTSQYSEKGRKGYNPIMLYAVLLYANMRGIRAIDRIVDLLERDILFMWLAQGAKPKRDVFYDFINGKLGEEILEDLHYQFIRLLHKEKLVTLENLFIDGTKIEANANRYTFVWRGSINYRLAGLLDNIETLFKHYNEFIQINSYHQKYKLPLAEMFVIEGIEKVKEVIEKNRVRKNNNKKKISNNSIIEIDDISPIKILKLQQSLLEIARAEAIIFETGKGKKKTELQKIYEELELLGKRLLKYKESFEIMGQSRNSYSKTDIEATFMRMKNDHMMNGQLKPAYNLQVAVENYFVIHTHISDDRTDYNTLIPVLEKHNKYLDNYPKEVTADSGYSSEKNLMFLKNHGIDSYIKLQTHEKMKTRAYKTDISKYYNMTKVEDGYICANDIKLEFSYLEKHKSKGFEQEFKVYRCSDCSGCNYKSQCLYKYDETKHKDKNKVIKVNERWDNLKAESHENIQSDKGIYYRHIRSIQTEGFFGDMKENDDFRKFYHRSSKKVYKESLLYIIGKNIGRYHKFLNGELTEYVMKDEQTVA
jgi:transposase